MDKQKNELIEPEASETRQASNNGHMAKMLSIAATPPLQDHAQNHKRHADGGYPDDERVKEGVPSGRSIDPLSDRYIHVLRSPTATSMRGNGFSIRTSHPPDLHPQRS
jgi:hypothetical protein